MNVLIQAGLFGAIICCFAIAAAFYKKSSLWKKFIFGLLVCLLILGTGIFAGPLIEQARTPAAQTPTAPLLEYQIQSVNAPSHKEAAAWRKGLLCSLTYNIAVAKEQPSEEEFKTIALDIIDKDAKNRNNWNIIYFYLHTPSSLKTAVAYMQASYALNGKEQQTNKIKPGSYNDRFSLTVLKSN